MITPRRTRLVRVPDLHVFRRTIVALAASHSGDQLIIVPTTGAARQLLRTVQVDPATVITRDELYGVLQVRSSDRRRSLTLFEREAMMHAAAAVHAEGLPFKLRPGLVAEMLRFYDTLRRQSQTVRRFEELLNEALGGGAGDADAGTARLLQQTAFLAGTFREYETRLAASGACDEHSLRAGLLEQPPVKPLRHVVVTVPDWIADRDGLFVADFDLLSRLHGLDTIDLVCTEGVLGSGFHERVHGWWPGLEEVSGLEICGESPTVRPRLLVPTNDSDAWFTFRDREEEMIAIARRVAAARAGETPPIPLDRIAIVFKRPLPYLYLAPETLGAAGLAWQSSHAFPLAAEPTAAVLDLIIEAAESDFTRTALVALLANPHVSKEEAIAPETLAAFDRLLSEKRYLGDPERLEALAAAQQEHALVFQAALRVAKELAPLLQPAAASVHLRFLIGFLDEHLTVAEPAEARTIRARAAVRRALTALADAHAEYYDPEWSIQELAASVRRCLGDQTFAPETGTDGIHLVDDQAVRFGAFDDIHVVGLVEHEWPERPRRNIFYSSAALKTLGWPSEKDRHSAAEASFVDLLRSAASSLTLSTFVLEDEALVTRSTQLDDVNAAGLSMLTDDARTADVLLPDERLATSRDSELAPLVADDAWLNLRVERSPGDDASFHGTVGRQPSRAWSVSALETYLECPFRFFARHILRLKEEPEDEEIMSPRHQGELVHRVFEEFFSEWQRSGLGAITPANLQQARSVFVATVDRLLVDVSPAEAALERTRLLGSSAAAGLGEAVLRMEAERPVRVVDRLLERRLDGELEVATEEGLRTVMLKGKADRIDLLEDGTLRVVDYKLGWPPNRARALQLPIYSLRAAQQLKGKDGRSWTLGEAMYLAFKGPKRVVSLFSSAADRDAVLAQAQQRLADTIDAIERGSFPPTPDDVFRCETCAFTTVCRKDYVGDV